MRKKVLLIDESVTIHKIVELTIDRQHFELLNAYDVSEALTIASDEAPSLVLIDNKLFSETPEETILEFREGNPNVGIVLLVGAYEQLVDQELEHTIVDDYIVKPFSSGTLNQVLADILAKKGESLDQPSTEIIDGIAALGIPAGDIQDDIQNNSPVHININSQEHRADVPDLGPINIVAENVNINMESPTAAPETVEETIEEDIEEKAELPSLDDLPEFDDPQAADIIDNALGDDDTAENDFDEIEDSFNDADITESINLESINMDNEDITIDVNLSNEDPETLEMLKMMEMEADEETAQDESPVEDEDESLESDEEIEEISDEDLEFAEQLAKDISDGELPEEDNEEDIDNNDIPESLNEIDDFEDEDAEPSSAYDFEAMEKMLAEEENTEQADPIDAEETEAASPMSEMLNIIDEAIESGDDTPIDMDQMDDLIGEMDINPIASAEPLDITIKDIQEPDEYNLSPDTSFADVENVMGVTEASEASEPADDELISDSIEDEMLQALDDEIELDDLQPATHEQVEEAFSPNEPDLFTEFQTESDDVYESTGFGDPNEETPADSKEERQELMSLFDELNLSYEKDEQPVTTADDEIVPVAEPALDPSVKLDDSDYAAKLVIELSKKDLVKLLENSVNKDLLEKIMKEVLQDSISEAVEKLVPSLAEKLVREELKLIKGE